MIRKRLKTNIIRKYLSKLEVLKNQREILNFSYSNKLIYLKPIPPPLCGGSVEHYYHYIFDLVLPLSTLLRKVPSDVLFELENIGPYTNRLLQLFPKRIRIKNQTTIDRDNIKPIIGMNPMGVYITREEIESFRNDICKILKIETTGNKNKIILIERMPSDQYFTEEARIRESGAMRRSILNHDELKSELQSVVRKLFEFQNLQSERISFREQVDLFSKAKVVIAQHGAGLTNCIWMKPKSIVVELCSHSNRGNFRTIGKLKQHIYYLFRVPGNHFKIEVDVFTAWLLGKDELKKFFLNTTETQL